MIVLFWLGVCMGAPIERVAPLGRQIGVVLGEAWLPRDSMVSAATGECGEQARSVQVLTVDPWYRLPGVVLAQVGQTGCVPADALTQAGPSGGDPVADARIRAEYIDRFGALDATSIKSTPWGRVALPMVHEFSAAELKQERVREKLQTPKQRERAVVAMGPMMDGHPVYAHFLGSDAPRSDRWGRPETVIRLLELSRAWAVHCRTILPATIPDANPETCLIQFGDLGWYNDLRPDPLGHRDHYEGTCVDIRLFRTTPSRYEAWWNRADDRGPVHGGYSQALTAAFLSFALRTASPSVVHFNDPVVVGSVEAVTAARGHDDHIHMCF
jgi:hypothetical protein